MDREETSGYGLSEKKQVGQLSAPEVNYLPCKLGSNNLNIALIGAGGIVEYHLRNYRELGLNVVAISNRDRAKAEKLIEPFYPEAKVFEDYQSILAMEEVVFRLDETTPIEHGVIRVLYHVWHGNVSSAVCRQKIFYGIHRI